MAPSPVRPAHDLCRRMAGGSGPPSDNAHAIGAAQIRARLRARPSADPPLVVFDAGYDPECLDRELGAAPVAVLVWLRRDRCFYTDPTSQPATGRPRRHGAKFICKEPTTWPAPPAAHATADGQYGRVRVRAWAGLHAKRQHHPGRGTHTPRPVLRGTVVLVEVERLSRWWARPPAPTLRPLTRPPERPPLWAGAPLSGAQEDGRTAPLNRFSRFPGSIYCTSRTAMVKSQAKMSRPAQRPG